MGLFRVKAPILHDGQWAEPGASLDLSAAAAEILLRLKVIEASQPPGAKPARPGKTET